MEHITQMIRRIEPAWLENDGFRVIRFWNNDVLNNIEAVLSAILLSFEGTPHPAPAAPPSPTRGEG
jgi:very-short-patch-repair endonuclease